MHLPMPMFSGLTIEPNVMVSDGEIVWLAGDKCLDIWSDGLVTLGGQVGFLREPPREATGMVVSPGDYERITGELAERGVRPTEAAR